MRTQDLTVLVIGSGARESALCWAIEKSPRVKRVLCTPGNGGTPTKDRRSVKESDIEGLVQLTKDEKVDLVVVGPEAPLCAGLADRLRAEGVPVFGPGKKAALLEGSKVYMKSICAQLNLPTAKWDFSTDFAHAKRLIEDWDGVPVIKADGLCAGKGVIVPDTKDEAIAAAHDMLVTHSLGHAGDSIVIESRLAGHECSLMAMCDGQSYRILPPARDYKRALDGDKGPNTGGMGAFSPVSDIDDALLHEIETRILAPTIRGMKKNGAPFMGLLYAGIMLTDDGPMLLEYNVRFGDPETQVVLPRLRSNIVEYMLACSEEGGLADLHPILVEKDAAVCVVLASEGYPSTPKTGRAISWRARMRGAHVFHAGTKREGNLLLTSGGRVLSVVGVGEGIADARQLAYANAADIHFDGVHYRTDIAKGI